MDMKQDGQVIFLKDLLFCALYKWRTVLVWGVVLAVLFGGYKGVTSYTGIKNETAQMEQEVYEARLASLQKQIDANRESVQQQQQYLDGSILMNLDAYGHYEVYLSCYLHTDYQIVPGMSYQAPDPVPALIRAYTDAVINETNAKQLADAIGTQPEYLRELVSVDTAYDNQGFALLVKTPDLGTADKLKEALAQVITGMEPQMTQLIAPHEVRIKENFARQKMDPDLALAQQEQADKLTEINDVIHSLQQQRSAITPAFNTGSGLGGVVKSAVIFAVIGGILGAVLVVLGAWIRHIFGGVVYSRKALTGRVGIKVFGCVAAEEKKNPVDRWLRAREGRNDLPTDQQNAMLACSVAAAMGNTGALQVSGSCSAKERTAFCEALRKTDSSITVCDAGNLLLDVNARQTLNQADCVLLLERCGVSTYSSVLQQADVVAEHGKKLLGCVLING